MTHIFNEQLYKTLTQPLVIRPLLNRQLSCQSLIGTSNTTLTSLSLSIQQLANKPIVIPTSLSFDTPKIHLKKITKKHLMITLILCLVLLPQLLTTAAFADDKHTFGHKARNVFTPIKKALTFKKNTQFANNTTTDTPPTNDTHFANHAPTDQPTNKTQDSSISNHLVKPDPNTPLTTQNSSTPELMAVLQAEFALKRNDPLTALQLYKQEANKQNATAVFERALGLSMQLEDPKESLSFAKEWQDNNQDHIPAWFFVTHLAIKAGDYETAAANINMILEYDPNMDLRQVFEGILPTDPRAQAELAHALEAVSNDENPSLSALKAGIFHQLGKHQTALLWVNQAVSAQPKNLAFLTLKADMLQEAGQGKALLAFLGQAIKNTSGETQKQLYLYQIRHLIDHGDLQTAFKTLKVAHSKFSDDHEITLLAGLVGLDIKAYDEAINLLGELTYHSAYAGQARYYLGIAFERQNRSPEAIANLLAVEDPEWLMSARKKILTHYLNAGRLDDAISLLIGLRENYPMFASESYILHADILAKTGQTNLAKTLLAHAVEEYPDDSELLYASTQLLDDNDDFVQKINNFAKLHQLEPYNLRYKFEQARLTLLKKPTDSFALTEVLEVNQLAQTSLDNDATLYGDTLLALAKNDLVRGNFLAVIARLSEPYKANPSLAMGELLLRAYYALGNHTEVGRILDELTERFGTKSANKDSQTPPKQNNQQQTLVSE